MFDMIITIVVYQSISKRILYVSEINSEYHADIDQWLEWITMLILSFENMFIVP